MPNGAYDAAAVTTATAQHAIRSALAQHPILGCLPLDDGAEDLAPGGLLKSFRTKHVATHETAMRDGACACRFATARTYARRAIDMAPSRKFLWG